MSRLHEFLKAQLGHFLLTALIAWALSRPVLALLDAMPEDLWALLWALIWALVMTLFTRLKPPVQLLATSGLLAAIILPAFLLPGSLPARAVNFIWAMASGAEPLETFRWHLDALIPLMLLLLALYARLLLDGDPAFSLPLVTAPLLMFWFAGAREDLSLYFPAVLSLPLLYAHGHPAQAPLALTVPDNRPRRFLGIKALALALTLALFAAWLTPATRQTLPQLEQMADRLRQTIEDYFLFTDSRRMFSLSSQGYQPMGEAGLGGSPMIPDTPLMTVRAAGKTYLRGTALDLYNGRAWFDTLSNERYGFQSMRFAGLKAGLFDEHLPEGERGQALEVTVEILDNLPSTLFVPQRLRALAPGEGMVPYFNASSELFITRDLRQGDSYTAGFEGYEAGAAFTDALAERFQGYISPDYEDILKDYTKLPEHLEPGGIIDALAREVAGNIHDPYQQGLALMYYLKNNFRYTLDVPDAPPTLDFASHFLFDLKEGYCTYFATAMTVLSRSLGLPARYVEGFLADPQGAETITLTARNAHAWTEIYIAGLGWVTFDATASDGDGDGNGNGDSPPQTPQPSPQPSPSPEPTPEPEEGPEESPSPSPSPGEPEPTTTPAPGETVQQAGQDDQSTPFPWWLVLMLLLLGLLIWRMREEEPERRAGKQKDPSLAFAILWQALLASRQAQGAGIRPQETAISWASRTAPDDAGMLSLARAYSALKYGRVTPEPDTLAFARIQYRAAWQALRPWHKARLMTIRAFVPLGGYLRRGVTTLRQQVRRKLRRG